MQGCFYLPAEDSVTAQGNCLYRPHWKGKVLSLRSDPRSRWLYRWRNKWCWFGDKGPVHVNVICNFFKKMIITPLYVFVVSGFSGFRLNAELRSIKSSTWMYLAALGGEHSESGAGKNIEEEGWLGSFPMIGNQSCVPGHYPSGLRK